MGRDTAEHSILQISLDPPWALGERTVRIPLRRKEPKAELVTC